MCENHNCYNIKFLMLVTLIILYLSFFDTGDLLDYDYFMLGKFYSLMVFVLYVCGAFLFLCGVYRYFAIQFCTHQSRACLLLACIRIDNL